MMTSLWYRCPFASAAFFCSKNSRHSCDGSVGMVEALGADAVRIRVFAMWLRRFSKLFLLELSAEADLFMRFCSTSCWIESAIFVIGLLSGSSGAVGGDDGAGSSRWPWSFEVASWMEGRTEYWEGTTGIWVL